MRQLRTSSLENMKENTFSDHPMSLECYNNYKSNHIDLLKCKAGNERNTKISFSGRVLLFIRVTDINI